MARHHSQPEFTPIHVPLPEGTIEVNLGDHPGYFVPGDSPDVTRRKGVVDGQSCTVIEQTVDVPRPADTSHAGVFIGGVALGVVFTSIAAIGVNQLIAPEARAAADRPAAAASLHPAPTITKTVFVTPTPTPTEAVSTAASPTPSSPSPTATAKAKVIFLDPGHSGKNINQYDTITGLKDVSAHNVPETQENYMVALLAKGILEKAGYVVVMSKDSVNDVKSSRDRSNEAKASGADIAVSIHDDHSATPKKFEAVYPQKVGQYRQQSAGNDETMRTTFQNKATACVSQAYAGLIQKARAKAQGMPVKIAALNFNHRKGYPSGNISLVQLFADTYKMPWVYNEMGALVGTNEKTKLPDATLQQYAKGIADGVIASMQQQDKIKKTCGVS